MTTTTTTTTSQFSSPTEEANFWRLKALDLERETREIKEEFREFQEESRELETELEAQLEQSERRVKEYRNLSSRMQMENDQLRSKLEQSHREYNFQVNELETELAEVKSIKDELNKYVRELEQRNDDLERAKRSTLASLEDFEARMNATIERNAFLESELDEKESLKASVQRLKDETRDLRAELRVLTAPAPPPSTPSIHHAATKRAFSLDSPQKASSLLDKTPDNDRTMNGRKKSLGSEKNNNISLDSNKLAATNSHDKLTVPPPLTPSARLSALNIVGDLLRKVGALELKLSSCRNIVKENGSSDVNDVSKSITNGTKSPVSSVHHQSRKFSPVTTSSAIKKQTVVRS